MVPTITKKSSRRTTQIIIKCDDEKYLHVECNVLYIFLNNSENLYSYYNVLLSTNIITGT